METILFGGAAVVVEFGFLLVAMVTSIVTFITVVMKGRSEYKCRYEYENEYVYCDRCP